MGRDSGMADCALCWRGVASARDHLCWTRLPVTLALVSSPSPCSERNPNKLTDSPKLALVHLYLSLLSVPSEGNRLGLGSPPQGKGFSQPDPGGWEPGVVTEGHQLQERSIPWGNIYPQESPHTHIAAQNSQDTGVHPLAFGWHQSSISENLSIIGQWISESSYIT